MLKRPWHREGQALVAHGQWRGQTVHLVKPLAFMNQSGPVVARSLQRLGAGPADLVLVYDDIDLPLGAVRTRMRGSHGGHKGGRSVLGAPGPPAARRARGGCRR